MIFTIFRQSNRLFCNRLFKSTLKNQSYCWNINFTTMGEVNNGITLQKVIRELEELAPLKYAENWDNVGLLIEPYTPRPIKTIFLTNDLTEAVLQEAIASNSDMIISYHPPIFSPLRRITQNNWKERIVSMCLENRIALYSPHTSWDFCRNGVNDWLASALPHSNSEPIQKRPDNSDGGMGRFLILRSGITLKKAINAIKEKLNVKDIRLAMGNGFNLDEEIKTAAICAGSGTSVLRTIHADLYVTGEMSHHELLNATQNNISVIICNHSNSERGYLKEFKKMLEQNLNNVNIIISKLDSDPLITY